MRRVLAQTLLGLTVMLGSATGLVSTASARDESLFIQASQPGEQSIVGSWQLTGEGAPGTPPEDPVLMTFSPDGVVIVSSRAVRPALPNMPHAYTYFSTGLGVWQSGEDGSVSFTVVHLRSDEAGTYLGSTTFAGTLVMGADGQSVTGDVTYTPKDPAGVARDPIPTTMTGQRIVIEQTGSTTPQA